MLLRKFAAEEKKRKRKWWRRRKDITVFYRFAVLVNAVTFHFPFSEILKKKICSTKEKIKKKTFEIDFFLILAI